MEQISHDFKFGAHIFNFDQLINHEWRTRLEVVADGRGKIAYRGFRGKYRLSWNDADGAEQSRVVDVKNAFPRRGNEAMHLS